MSKDLRRHNHYVPEWYQKQFLSQGQQKLWMLNKTPDAIIRPDGTPVLSKGKPKFYNAITLEAPSASFAQTDLYTTQFFGSHNDQIERFLFGKIDDAAARLLPKFVKEGWQELPEYGYDTILSYIGIQRLRTPAGLDLLKLMGRSVMPFLMHGQEALMSMMSQSIDAHLAMWAEGFQEIVSAKDSDIKFIITDHPVTFYNRAAFPGSKHCRYPHDPSLTREGTQTLFVTDPDHCMIFTHQDFANTPDTVNPMKERINARFFGETLHRLDDWILGRNLNRKEVAAINYLLKTRAKRYVAAGKKEWLLPEKDALTTHWSNLRKVTLPKGPLGRLGDMYVGYDNGRVYHQDAYGRHTKSERAAKEELVRMQAKVKRMIAKEKTEEA